MACCPRDACVCRKTETRQSWLAYQIAIAIASGGSVLGQIRVRQGEVLYMALEDGRSRLQWRLKTLLRGAPIPEGLHLATDWPALDDDGMDDLESGFAFIRIRD